MRPLILSAFLLACFFVSAQKEIKAEDIAKHVGDSVKVCGKIFTTRYFENAPNSPTLLNVDGAYPNQIFTIVIYSDVRKEMGGSPEVEYKEKKVCITGKVDLYRNKPQIVLHSASQLTVQKEE
jgi:hypothetical protein